MSAQKRKIEWFEKNSTELSEIYQQTGVMFSFLSAPKDGNKQCHEWIKCRDYLHDAVRTTLTNNTSSIYGFRFEKGKNPDIDIRKMRMLVTRDGLATNAKKTEFRNKMKAGLLLLQHFEKYAGVALSTMKEVDSRDTDKQLVFLFTGSAIWVKAPSLVSMYTFLIRLGTKEFKYKNAPQLKKVMKTAVDDFKANKKPYAADNDVSYLVVMWQHLHTVMKERNNIFVKKDGFDDSYFQNTGIHNFHNYGGILSLIKGCSPNSNLNQRVNKILHAKQKSI